MNIPEGDCDCEGNQLDECGICDSGRHLRMRMFRHSEATVTAMATSLTSAVSVVAGCHLRVRIF